MAKRKCSMPSDRLNGRAKKDYTKSGQCVSTDTKASVSLEQFEKEDHYLQVARVRTYGQHFGWSAKVVAEKLGTTVENAEKILRRLDLAEEFSEKAALYPEAAAATANFSNEKEDTSSHIATPVPKQTGKESELQKDTLDLRPMPLSEFGKLPDSKQFALCLHYGERYGWCADAVACALDTTKPQAETILNRLRLFNNFKSENNKLSADDRYQQTLRRKAETGRKEPKRYPQDATPFIFSTYRTQHSAEDASPSVKHEEQPTPASTTPSAKPKVEVKEPQTPPAAPDEKIEPLSSLLYYEEFMALAKSMRKDFLLHWGEDYGWSTKTVSLILGISLRKADRVLAAHRCATLYQSKKKGNSRELLSLRAKRRDAALAARAEQKKPVPTQASTVSDELAAPDTTSIFSKTSVEKLDFSVPTFRVLRRCGCNTVQDILAMDRKTIDGLRNVGNRLICEVAERLKILGAPMNAWEELRQERLPVSSNEPKPIVQADDAVKQSQTQKPLAKQAEELEATLPRELLALLLTRYEAAAAKDATLLGNFTKFNAQGNGAALAARLHAFADTLSPDTEYSIKLTIIGR